MRVEKMELYNYRLLLAKAPVIFLSREYLTKQHTTRNKILHKLNKKWAHNLMNIGAYLTCKICRTCLGSMSKCQTGR